MEAISSHNKMFWNFWIVKQCFRVLNRLFTILNCFIYRFFSFLCRWLSELCSLKQPIIFMSCFVRTPLTKHSFQFHSVRLKGKGQHYIHVFIYSIIYCTPRMLICMASNLHLCFAAIMSSPLS